MRLEIRRDVIFVAVGFAVAWVLLSFTAPNLWWLVFPTAVVVYLLVRRFGGGVRGRS